MKVYGLLLLLLICSCKPAQDPPAVSFYYWKTTFKLDPVERTALAENSSEKLYLRYFDVGLSQSKPFPISAIIFKERPTQTIIPVVYIKNEVLLQDNISVSLLAKQISDYIQQINKHQKLTTQELQIDCDWTLTSKARFFALLEALKKLVNGPLSATIRLHQVKYFEKTGIPPVDYGVLMYYNMGKLSPNMTNSIYDSKTAAGYLRSLLVYPLALKIALPIFGWGVHIRQGKVINLLNRLSAEALADTHVFERQTDGKYKILQDGRYFGQLFVAGDLIKLEAIDAPTLDQMATELNKHINNKPTEIIFYDLDQTNIQHYAHDLFQKTAARFH